MTRGGRSKTRDVVERRCIVTGTVAPTSDLVRFVVGPDDAIVPDVAGKLPGRGIWVTAERPALERAAAKGLFARGAKRAVTVPPDLAGAVESALLQRVTQGLSLARKAGLAVAGFEKVKDWLLTGEASVLVQAADGSERGKSKLKPPEGEGTHVGCLTGSEIGLAFGRDHVIHAALAPGGLATRVVEDAKRLSGVRGIGGDPVTGKDDKIL